MGLKVDPDSECLQHISAAAFGGDAPVAMLNHHGSARCEHKHTGGGDIKKLHPVATGSADINHRSLQFFLANSRIHCMPEQSPNKSCQLFSRFAFLPKRFEETSLEVISGC